MNQSATTSNTNMAIQKVTPVIWRSFSKLLVHQEAIQEDLTKIIAIFAIIGIFKAWQALNIVHIIL